LIESVDRTATAISAVAVHGSISAPSDLIRARRMIAGQIQEMNRAIDEILVVPLTNRGSAAAIELRKSYMERSNQARSAMADHQGKWPAVEMRNATDRYRTDVARLHQSQKAYRDWLKVDFVPRAIALLEI
jgi:pyrimidine operon attenuation protein/uracil phosphoribosyltransferase